MSPCNQLTFARASFGLKYKTRKGRASPILVRQLEKSIKRTLALLGRLKKYPNLHDINIVLHQVDSRVINVARGHEMSGIYLRDPPNDQELCRRPTIAADEMLAVVDIEALLRKIMINLPRQKPGGPRKEGKEAIVFHALQFFQQHSPCKPTTDPDNPFAYFAERFYEVVVGSEPDGLERQIKKVLSTERNWTLLS
jgi:hypothetical protein